MSTKQQDIRGGTFIVVEGVDGVGKSTLVKSLAQKFRAHGFTNVHEMHFPNRSTATGKQINAYLQDVKSHTKTMDPKTLQALFIANRREAQPTIRDILEDPHGVIVCDRYSPSGIAYAVAAEGMDL